MLSEAFTVRDDLRGTLWSPVIGGRVYSGYMRTGVGAVGIVGIDDETLEELGGRVPAIRSECYPGLWKIPSALPDCFSVGDVVRFGRHTALWETDLPLWETDFIRASERATVTEVDYNTGGVVIELAIHHPSLALHFNTIEMMPFECVDILTSLFVPKELSLCMGVKVA